MNINLWVEQRNRWFAHPEMGSEWVLWAKMEPPTARKWCLAIWDRAPRASEIRFAKNLVISACYFYRAHSVPSEFNLEEQK